MLAMTMAVAALAVDMVLPAFAAIREDFGLPADSTTPAQIITAFLLGMASAQAAYGPLADRFGRKPVLYAGFTIYAIGAAGVAVAPTIPLVLASRFVWGVGAAAARVVAQAVIRDRFEGDEMARALSYVMTVFLLVPVVAPLLGAVLVAVGPWQTTAWAAVVFVAILAVWIRRLPETLTVEARVPLTFTRIRASGKEIASTRLTAGTTMGLTVLFGAFTSYLASSELIIGQVYGRPEAFPVIFGVVAAAMGTGSIANARIVTRFGTGAVLRAASWVFVGVAGVLLVFTLATEGKPPLVPMLIVLTACLTLYMLIIPNANTLALLPLPHIAGTAAAVIGTVNLMGGAILGALVDRQFDDTFTPLPAALLIYGVIALVLFEWALAGRDSDAKTP